MTQGEEAPGCADGCLFGVFGLILVPLAIGGAIFMFLLIGVCFQKVFAEEPEGGTRDCEFFGYAGVIPSFHACIPFTYLAEDVEQEEAAEQPPRTIELDFIHSRTSFNLDYTKVCTRVDFTIPKWHLGLMVWQNDEPIRFLPNETRLATAYADDHGSSTGCLDASVWRSLGGLGVNGLLVHVPPSEIVIRYLKTFDSETRTATAWSCGRREVFGHDALFSCSEGTQWQARDLREADTGDALLAIRYNNSDANFRISLRSSEEGLSGAVISLEFDDLLNQHPHVLFDDLPANQWFNHGGGWRDRPEIGWVTGGRGVYCMPKDEEMVLCDFWSENP